MGKPYNYDEDEGHWRWDGVPQRKCGRALGWLLYGRIPNTEPRRRWFAPFLAQLKYRFDLGAGFFVIVNFALLVIAAGDKIATLVHVSVAVIALVMVPACIFAIWLLGYILDKMDFAQAYTEECNRRNAMLKDVHERLQKPITKETP